MFFYLFTLTFLSFFNLRLEIRSLSSFPPSPPLFSLCVLRHFHSILFLLPGPRSSLRPRRNVLPQLHFVHAFRAALELSRFSTVALLPRCSTASPPEAWSRAHPSAILSVSCPWSSSVLPSRTPSKEFGVCTSPSLQDPYAFISPSTAYEDLDRRILRALRLLCRSG